MQTDMTIKEKATRLWAILGLCSLGISITSCDSGELPVGRKDSAQVELRFSASISDCPSTKVVPQPTITEGTAFDKNKTHTFGMFITREDGTTALVTGSEDNMKSTLTVSGSTQKWGYTDKGDTPITLKANNGDKIKITGYYPWTTDATATAVPFDLSSTDPTQWTDLLYLSEPTAGESSTITDNNAINLTFSHAFCWVTINLTKLSGNNTVTVKAVNIGNAYAGQGTIVNKGSINPKTGKINKSPISGPLKIDLTPPITLEESMAGSPAVFHFLVPPVMRSDIKNSDIVIEVTTIESSDPEVEKVLTFPLSQSHLNQDVAGNPTLYGFQQGMHNTYNIVYNNSAMILSLSDWQTVVINESGLGVGTSAVQHDSRTFNAGDVSTLGYGGESPSKFTLTSDNHIYHTYLGEVAENNNGEYRGSIESQASDDITNQWKLAWQAAVNYADERPYPTIHVAKNYAAGGAQIPWKDKATGTLLAKQACVEFREGGYTDWRLPRISECFMVVYNTKGINLSNKDFWSATEADADNCYAAAYDNEGKTLYYVNKRPKTEYLYVRCVRDADNPKPKN